MRDKSNDQSNADTSFLPYLRWFWLILCLIVVYTPTVYSQSQFQVRQMQGQQAFTEGKFEHAIKQWKQALAESSLSDIQQADLLIQLATAYQALGYSRQSQQALKQALTLTQTDNTRQALIYSSLSDWALATQQEIQARHYADKSLALLPANAPAIIRATLLNNVGNVLMVEAYYTEAVQHYENTRQLAEEAHDSILVHRAMQNMARAYFKNKQYIETLDTLAQLWKELSTSPPNYQTAFSLINVGELTLRLYETITTQKTTLLTSEVKKIAHQFLQKAQQLAIQLQNKRLHAYANGYLGHLYELTHQYDDALQLTRQAIFYAQQQEALDILYRWQWQLGRLFKAKNQLTQSIEAYRHAVETLQTARQEITVGYRHSLQSFRNAVEPVYFGLADLLLQEANVVQDKKPWLKEARETIEKLKTVELQNYFQDECLTGKNTFSLIQSLPYTTVLYPILLQDRIEMLLSLPSGIKRVSMPISSEKLKDEVNEFRFELESRETEDYLPYAQRLYQWLIAPLLPLFNAEKISTLVIVPDGVLRTIPFAALHDGRQFLIQKYAIATVPNLTLTDAKPVEDRTTKVLLSGLAESVQGYGELLSVRQEIDSIQALYQPETKVLLDKEFTLDNFSQQLGTEKYSIVHIASHGQFVSNPRKTFLLTYDSKLSIKHLENLLSLGKLRQEPVELLTLSACQTAAGDDRAALGLAGIAVKAGARSALATLWFIDDEATAELVTEFYRYLKGGSSKVRALQSAQKYLLQKSEYKHPAFWAPFLLIGNWR